MDSVPYLHHGTGAIYLDVHVQPGAKRTELAGLHGDALKIRISGPPVDGKANAELVRFLAGLLQLPRSQVTVAQGQRSRRKRLALTGIDFARAAEHLVP